jgi:hypothetical protein
MDRRGVVFLLLLGFTLGLPQRPVANVDVHAAVHLDDNVRPLAEEARQKPLHQSVTPVRSTRECNVLRTARAANLAKRSLDELLGVGYESGGLANLGHGGGDKVGLDALHVDTVWLELGAESGGPLLQEGLAAGVGRQKGCWEEPTKRGHGEDKSTLALLHTRSDELGDAQGGHAVDDNDVVHLLLRCLVEGNRNVVAQTNVVDQDGDIKSVNELGELGVVGVLVLGKVHCQRLDRGLGAILGGDVGGERVELGLGARHEDQVIAFGCEGESKLLADAIGGSGDESPCATRTELGELSRM